MIKLQGGPLLSDLLETKSITEEERRKIIVTSAALNMIAVALSTEDNKHTLPDEMSNLDSYVEKIEKNIR